MIVNQPARRRAAQTLARTGVMGSAVMAAITGYSLLSSGLPRASAAPTAGVAQIVSPDPPNAPLAMGGSATNFTLGLPSGAACAGDSTNAGYRWQTYMVPSTVDPASLQFGSTGPKGTGNRPLFDVTGNPVVNQQTQNQTTSNGPGVIANIPAFNFAVYTPGQIPPGSYNVGIACTLGPASATQLDRYWNATMTFTANTADRPAGVTWTAAASTTATTTSSTSTSTSTSTTSTSTSTTTTSTTSTTVPETTTTLGESTTTTTASTTSVKACPAAPSLSSAPAVTASTTSTAASPAALSSTTTTSAPCPGAAAAPAPVAGPVSGGGTSVGGSDFGATVAGASGAALPRTGTSPTPFVIWAALLLVFGRMAILLGRTTEVR